MSGIVVDFLIITRPVTSPIIDLKSLTTMPIWLLPNVSLILFLSLWYGSDFVETTAGLFALSSLFFAPLNVFIMIVVTTWQTFRIKKKLRVKSRVLKLEEVL